MVCSGKINSFKRIIHLFLFSYDPQTEIWTEVEPLTSARLCLGLGGLDGLLYAVGGVIKHSISNLVESYNPVENKWSTMAPMIKKRCSLSVSAVEGYLYAVGGEDGRGLSKIDSIERYDPKTDSWSMVRN